MKEQLFLEFHLKSHQDFARLAVKVGSVDVIEPQLLSSLHDQIFVRIQIVSSSPRAAPHADLVLGVEKVIDPDEDGCA